MDLKGFKTGDPSLPVVYLDPDSCRVFAHKQDRWKVDIVEVDAQQFRTLVEQYRLRSLIGELIRNCEEILAKSRGMVNTGAELLAQAKALAEHLNDGGMSGFKG